VPDFVFEPIVTFPFLPRDERLTLADAALATVAFTGRTPQSIVAANRNNRILCFNNLPLFFIIFDSFPG
jgi:hypothetical protein